MTENIAAVFRPQLWKAYLRIGLAVVSQIAVIVAAIVLQADLVAMLLVLVSPLNLIAMGTGLRQVGVIRSHRKNPGWRHPAALLFLQSILGQRRRGSPDR